MSVYKRGKKWEARAFYAGKMHYLGQFKTKQAGQEAVEEARGDYSAHMGELIEDTGKVSLWQWLKIKVGL